jgi:hypothetical protein
MRYAIEQSRKLKEVSAVYAFHNGDPVPEVNNYRINALNSLSAYSDFVINVLPHFIEEDYCLIIQWDGFVVNAAAWIDDFLAVDYIGAPWPASMGGNLVGNGGFSLRSKKFLNTSKKLGIIPSGGNYQDSAEDVILCRKFYDKMVDAGISYANLRQAELFSFEDHPMPQTLGFHGPFNLPRFVEEEILCLHSEELIARVSNNLIMSKLILNALCEQKLEFATKLINRVRQEYRKATDIAKVFEVTGNEMLAKLLMP